MSKIKEARNKYKLTQHQLAELTGIPFRTIQNWEGGQRKCPGYVESMVVEKLDRILGEQSEVIANNATATGGWISVYEKMPDEHEIKYRNCSIAMLKKLGIKDFTISDDIVVLVMDFENNRTFINLDYTKNGEWQIWDNADYMVTHWMPIIEPPKMKGADNEQ